jgi:hypothetical protein
VQKVREFRNWYEPWEMMVFKKEGNQYHKQLVEMKYGGLSFKSLEDGNPGFTLKEGCAVKIRCSADMRYGTELQAVDGCCWFYGVLICYDGFDIELPYEQQHKDLYDIMELMNSDFYQGIEDYYAENLDPRIKIIKRGERPSWKLPAEHDYARKGGVYVGGEYESDDDSDGSDEENDFEG